MSRNVVKYWLLNQPGGENLDYKIHIAYGFHVNCYHSYRGDTPDAQGFGSDIRIIRKIIETLDTLNAEGIPVKGT